MGSNPLPNMNFLLVWVLWTVWLTWTVIYTKFIKEENLHLSSLWIYSRLSILLPILVFYISWPGIFLLVHLQNRKFVVSIGGMQSHSSPISWGVPQGSVLSPTLFTILLSDLLLPSFAHFVSYADDIAMCVKSKDLLLAQLNMQAAADTLLYWAKTWGLQLNLRKSVLMCYTKRKIPFLPHVAMNTQDVPFKNTHKFLGLHIDSPTLTWRTHIDYLQKNCMARLNLMKRVAGPS